MSGGHDESKSASIQRDAHLEVGAITGVALLTLIAIIPQQPLSDLLQRALFSLSLAIPILTMALLVSHPIVATTRWVRTSLIMAAEFGAGFLVVYALGALIWQANTTAGKAFWWGFWICLGLVIVVVCYSAIRDYFSDKEETTGSKSDTRSLGDAPDTPYRTVDYGSVQRLLAHPTHACSEAPHKGCGTTRCTALRSAARYRPCCVVTPQTSPSLTS
jgi:hypothetical protein